MRRLYLLTFLLAAGGIGAAPAWSTQIYWLDSSFASPKLTRAYADGFQPVSINLPAHSLPQWVAMDSTSQTLYWADLNMQNAHVEQVSSTLANYTPPAPGPTPYSCLRGIAVDAVQHQLYLTSTNLQTGPLIQRVNEDGTGLVTVLAFGAGSASEPHGLALDPGSGLMYWCDYGRGTIERAAMSNGAGRVDLITGLSRPEGIVLDLVNHYIYWTDSHAGEITRANLDGTGATVWVSGLSFPVGLTLDPWGRKLYWTEQQVPAVRSVNLDGTGVTTIPVQTGFPIGIFVAGSAPAGVASSAEPRLDFALDSPAPNPAFGAADLAFSLPRAGVVRLGVFDVQGREIARLAEGAYAAGRHAAIWDGRTGGAQAATGVYFVRCAWQGKEVVQRLTWIR